MNGTHCGIVAHYGLDQLLPKYLRARRDAALLQMDNPNADRDHWAAVAKACEALLQAAS